MRTRKCLYRLALTAAAVLAGALASTATAAAPIHTSGTDGPFPVEDFCGFNGTGIVRFVDNFFPNADGSFRDTSESVFTFTSDTGKTVSIQAAGQVTGVAPIIDTTNGTITFVNTFIGLPERIFIPGQGSLSRDAGRVTLTTTFTLNPDGSMGDFVSRTFSDEAGPHPDLESNFELFCDVITPFLQDP